MAIFLWSQIHKMPISRIEAYNKLKSIREQKEVFESNVSDCLNLMEESKEFSKGEMEKVKLLLEALEDNEL